MSHDAFMRAIRAAPDDDAPRLVYADWLEENGDPARAEFIRVQCARARLPADDPAAEGLNARAHALLADNWEAWVGPLRDAVGPNASRVGEAWLLGGFHRDGHWHFRRGFVEALSLTATALLRHADGLFRVAPLRHLMLWDAGLYVADVARLPYLAGVDLLWFSDPWREPVRADGIAALAASPHLGRLTTLNLSRNDVADDGAAVLARAPWLGGLRSLNLEENGLSSFAAAALAASPGVAGLTSLELAGNAIADEGLQALASSPHLANLRWLGLKRNPLSRAARRIVANSPCFGPRLAAGTLEVTGCPDPDRPDGLSYRPL